MSEKNSQEYKEMKEILNRETITEIYHFTSINNLQSIIKEGALLSINQLKEKGLENSVNHGGNILSRNLNGQRGTLDYIKLSFRKKQPMAYRLEREKHLIFFIIDPSVILLEHVLFTSENSTAITCETKKGLEGLLLIDFESIKDGMAWQDKIKKRKIQAEILVPDRIEINKVKKICFISKSSLEEANRLCKNFKTPPFEIDDSYFFAKEIFYTEDAVLTRELVSRENIKRKFSNKTTFTISSNNQITLLIIFKSFPGLKCKFVWKDECYNIIQIHSSHEYYSQNYFYIWDILTKDKMKSGNFIVSFFLNNIRQLTIPFEIEDG